MKITIETEGFKNNFLYTTIIEGNIYLAIDQEEIIKNLKTFDIQNDFNVKPVSYSKRESSVIVTTILDKKNKIQFLITSKSNYLNCPIELREVLKLAFDLAKPMTLKDLENIMESDGN